MADLMADLLVGKTVAWRAVQMAGKRVALMAVVRAD